MWTVTYRDGHTIVDMMTEDRERSIEAACALIAAGKRVVSIEGNDEFIAEAEVMRLCTARHSG
jgi:hypothetical protein